MTVLPLFQLIFHTAVLGTFAAVSASLQCQRAHQTLPAVGYTQGSLDKNLQVYAQSRICSDFL